MIDSPAKEPRKPIRQVFGDALYQIVVNVIEHLPLVVGIALVLGLDLVRRSVSTWGLSIASARLVKIVVFLGEATFLLSLVLPKTIELLTELAETVAVAHHRVKGAWRRGRRSRRQ